MPDQANHETSNSLKYQDLIETWYQRVTAAQKCHYLASERFSKYNYFLGIPTIILSTIVGASVFSSLSQNPKTQIIILVGLASLAAAVLSSLQTFLSFSEKAEKHRLFGTKYGMAGREMERIKSSRTPICEEELDMIQRQLDEMAKDAPRIPEDLLIKVKRAMDKDPNVVRPLV